MNIAEIKARLAAANDPTTAYPVAGISVVKLAITQDEVTKLELLQEALNIACALRAQYKQDIPDLIARVDELEAALRPFAEEGREWPELKSKLGLALLGSEHPIVNDTQLTVTDFLLATKTLNLITLNTPLGEHHE